MSELAKPDDNDDPCCGESTPPNKPNKPNNIGFTPEVTTPNIDPRYGTLPFNESGLYSTFVTSDHSSFSVAQATIHNKISSILSKKIITENLQFNFHGKVTIVPTNGYKIISDYLNTFSRGLMLLSYNYLAKTQNSLILFYLDGGLDRDTDFINFNVYSNSIENLKLTLDIIRKALDPISVFKNNIINISWYYQGSKGMDYVVISDEINDNFHIEAYPYLNIEELSLSYWKCNEPIMVLMGPPGTGKTRLIRYMIDSICKNEKRTIDVMFSSDQAVIEQGELFMCFLKDRDCNFLVLEDVDYHLGARKDGNTAMYNFLSISNGLAVNLQKSKKIILSTNLPNIKNIDPALLRPGRCYDIINTRELDYYESNDLLKKIGTRRELDPKKLYTLANLYNFKEIKEKPSKISTGFI